MTNETECPDGYQPPEQAPETQRESAAPPEGESAPAEQEREAEAEPCAPQGQEQAAAPEEPLPSLEEEPEQAPAARVERPEEAQAAQEEQTAQEQPVPEAEAPAPAPARPVESAPAHPATPPSVQFPQLDSPARQAPAAQQGPRPRPAAVPAAAIPPRPTQSAAAPQQTVRKKKKSTGAAVRVAGTLGLVALAAVGGWLLRGGTLPPPQEASSVSVPAVSQAPVEPPEPVKDLTASEANGAIGILRLANTQYPLPDGYVPPELVDMDGEGRQLDARAAEPLREMFAAAKADGVTLVLTSGYRSEERQKTLFVSMVQDYLGRGYSQADAYTATKRLRNIPGTSEHQTGLAADIITPDYWELDDGFADTAAAKWMVENAADYGFILRYPKDKTEITGTSFEPWHYRYVGVDDAKQIMEQKLCLEEYLGAA